MRSELRDVEVWEVVLDPSQLASAMEDVSPEERSDAARCAPAVGTRRLLRRAALRRILARHVGGPPRELRLARGRWGKPELPGSDLCFSSSSAGDLCLIAVARGRRVGIDVERVRGVRNLAGVAAREFGPDVAAGLLALPADRRDREFLRRWTEKEARGKALGVGLGEGVPPGAAGARWRIEPVVTPSWSVGTLAVEVVA